MFQCVSCLKSFSHQYSLSRHMRESCSVRVLKRVCSETPKCEKRQKFSNDVQITLPSSSKTGIKRLKQDYSDVCEGVEKINSAFKCRICSYRFSTKKHLIDHREFFTEIKSKVQTFIKDCLARFTTVKVNFELFANYVKQESENFDTKSFLTKNTIITGSDDLDVKYDELIEEIMTKAETFQEKDSGR